MLNYWRVRADLASQTAQILHQRVLAIGPHIGVETKAGTRRYHRGDRLFCVMRPLATRVDVGFFKLGRARSKRILHAQGKLPFVPYSVIVEAPGDVDHELLSWLAESYELAGDAT